MEIFFYIQQYYLLLPLRNLSFGFIFEAFFLPSLLFFKRVKETKKERVREREILLWKDEREERKLRCL